MDKAIFDRADILNAASVIPQIRMRIDFFLRNGYTLTQADANKWPFCTSRLASRISELRKAGCPIEKRMIKVECGDGHVAVVAEYYLKGD